MKPAIAVATLLALPIPIVSAQDSGLAVGPAERSDTAVPDLPPPAPAPAPPAPAADLPNLPADPGAPLPPGAAPVEPVAPPAVPLTDGATPPAGTPGHEIQES